MPKIRKALLVLLAVLLAAAGSGIQPPPAAHANEQRLLLHYDMRSIARVGDDVMIQDVAGQPVAYDGIFRNIDKGSYAVGSSAGFVSFAGGGANAGSGYVEIPKGSDGRDLLQDRRAVTISALVKWTDDGENRWIFGFGSVATPETNKYLFASPRHGHGGTNSVAAGISKQGWPSEALLKGPNQSRLPSNQWKHVAVTMSEASNQIALYVDGSKIGERSAENIKLADLVHTSSSFSGFLGKSIFSGDSYLNGSIADFRVYDDALASAEVSELYAELSGLIPVLDELAIDDALRQLSASSLLAPGDTAEAVTASLTLPTLGKHGVQLSWASDQPSVIAADGAVTRPALQQGDTAVRLTVTATYNSLVRTGTYDFIVLEELTDQSRVELDRDAIAIHNTANVKGNLRLPTTGANGSTITWSSSRPDIVKGTAEASSDPKALGRVVRPSGADAAVTLTATIAYGGSREQRAFDLVVRQAAGAPDYGAYFFAYFTGEYEGGEEISFAAAEDPLYWRALNNGKSVLQSGLGERGLRDPFIIRSPEGDKFYMLATDLKMGESTNFDQAQITGSHYMMVWESDDLVNWSEQRMVKVAPEKGGNTWAPEAFYDETTGEYVVFWASSMKVADTYGKFANGRPAGQYNVMYYATTRDFYDFSEPKVYIDEALPTIDTTMIEHDGSLYRFTKSETNFKVYYEKADSIYYDRDGIADNGFQFEPVAGTRSGQQGLIGHAGNNEGQTIFKALGEDKWYLFLDSWPYHVRYTTDLDDGQQLVDNLVPHTDYALPPGPRHGTVIPITRVEYDALQAKYGMPGPAVSADPVVHYTFDPDTVTGVVVADQSGNGHDAALVGGATIDTSNKIGKRGGAARLDGSSGYIKLPDNLIASLNLERTTLAMWVQTGSGKPNQHIFDFASDTGRAVNRNTMYLGTREGGGLEFALVTPFTEKFANEAAPLADSYKYALRSSHPTTGAWSHVAITIDGFDAAMYVNGARVADSSTFNVEPRMLLETTLNALGKSGRAADGFLKGSLDDFRIYNYALSAEQIGDLADETHVPGPIEEQSDAELLLHYDMKAVSGSGSAKTIQDAVGSADGVWRNSDKGEWIASDQAGVVRLPGTAADSYIELPGGLLDGLTDITVSSLVNWSGKQSAEWLYALGRPTTNTHYVYFTPKYNSDGAARFGIADNGWRNEPSAKHPSTLTANAWKTVTTVMSGTDNTLKLYIDGKLAAEGAAGSISLEAIRAATGASGYIGKSFYTGDPYFGGMIADFRIYDGALTAAEVGELHTAYESQVSSLSGMLVDKAAQALTIEAILAANDDEESVISNLTLPASGDYGTAIAWASSDAATITAQGVVTRPAFAAGDRSVTLTATLSDGRTAKTKSFVVNVLKLPAAQQLAELDSAAIKVYNLTDVRGNLTLPPAGEYGSVIAWQSSAPSIVSHTGVVNRPAYGRADARVRLTATVTNGGATATRRFEAHVKAMPQPEDLAGYFFTYFTGEGTASGEQIYFALSDGNDALSWVELNNGQPVLTSDLGEKGLRDPYIIRSPEGDKFYLIATDLRIYGNGNWDRAQRNGSRSIMVWESTDLIRWSEQRMVEVSPPEAGNTWAPEIMYDRESGCYVLFWASKIYPDATRSGHTYQRMMYAKTRDFHTFTEAQVYMDYGYSIIDTTMLEHDGKIYRFTKDERDNVPSASPYGKTIFQDRGSSVLADDFELLKEGIGDMKWVEGPTAFKSNTEDKWYLFVDEFGGRGYVPLETTDLDAGAWTLSQDYDLPSSPRHGTVVPVTKSQYEALYARYVTKDATPPADVIGATATSGDGKLTLTWTDPADADVQRIQIIGQSGIALDNVYVGKGVGRYVIDGLVNGTTYQFALKAVDKAGNASTGVTVQGTPRAATVAPPYNGGSDGGSTTPTTPAQPEESGGSQVGEVRLEGSQVVVKPVPGADGTAQARINAETVREALKLAKDGKLVIQAAAAGAAERVQLEIALGAAEGASKVSYIAVDTGAMQVTIAAALAERQSTDEAGQVTITAGKAAKSQLTPAAVEAIGDDAAYVISMEVDGKAAKQAGVKGDVIVALDYKLKPGERASQIVVTRVDASGEHEIVTNGKYDPATGQVVFKPSEFGVFTVARRSASFSDVTGGWAQEAIEALAVRGVVQGKGDGAFQPQGEVTRAEFVRMLLGILELSDSASLESPFVDVDTQAWYASDAATAYRLGIANGRADGTFDGNARITRQEMAVMAHRAARAAGRSIGSSPASAAAFTDQDEIAEYAGEAVAAMREAGVIRGMGDGSYAPQQTATRAQAAVVILQLLELD